MYRKCREKDRAKRFKRVLRAGGTSVDYKPVCIRDEFHLITTGHAPKASKASAIESLQVCLES